MNASPYLQLIKRPEVISFIVATVVTGLVQSGIAKSAGLPLPEAEVGMVVSLVWSVFVGFLVEGKYRGLDYAGGLKQFLGSKKVHTATITIVVVALQSVLKPFAVDLPESALVTLVTFALSAIAGMTGLDAYQAMRLNTKQR